MPRCDLNYQTHPLESNTSSQLKGAPANDVVYGDEMVSAWYLAVEQSLEPRTPPHMNIAIPLGSSTSSPEQDTSSPYKGRVVNFSPLQMELRSTAAQKLRKLRSRSSVKVNMIVSEQELLVLNSSHLCCV